MNASKAKKPNFVVTKYRKKEVEKRLPISRGLTGNARTQVPPAIRASGRAFPRVNSASKLQVPDEKFSAWKGKGISLFELTCIMVYSKSGLFEFHIFVAVFR